MPKATEVSRTAALADAPNAGAIEIRGARSHNLRGVDCEIPLYQLTVVTGVSGSGKSTLAFDTLYAEGQRRYVTSLSTYARQFLERLPRPDVDSISNLPPAIAIEQHNRVSNARSTVGTATEILDHLRLLFAKVGETRCPDCDIAVAPATIQSVVERLLGRHAGQRLTVAAPLVHRPGEKVAELRERLAREGFTRLIDSASGEVLDVVETTLKELTRVRKQALLVIDRLVPKEEERSRLAEAVAAAFARGEGELVALNADGEGTAHREGFACSGCGRTFRSPEPALFSFNSPLGACETCQGFGRTAGIDPDRIVPDPTLSLDDGAIAPFTTAMGAAMKRDMLHACRDEGISLDASWEDLGSDVHSFVLKGNEEEGGDWYGVRGFFDWLERRRYKVQARVLIARYRRFDTCPDCQGARLCEDALCVRVAGRTIAELSSLTIEQVHTWSSELASELDARSLEIAQRLIPLLCARIATVDEVGLGYIGLDRQLRTLSGGEAQRIQLATALSGALTTTLYILDEPSIGLHARDVDRLLTVLRRIRDHGNTVVVVEHALEIVRSADHVIDLGPAAGRAGGECLTQGSVEEVASHPASQTGRALRGELPSRVRRPRKSNDALRIRGARANNLEKLDVEIPLGQLVAITGVSGAGKSTLVRSVLVGQLQRDPERGFCDRIEGAELVREVVVVDQTPAARSPRSNPATVTKAFDGIRSLFAASREAKRLGVGPGWFSFNVAGGRCEACEGAGEVVIDMQFLDDVRVPCEACNGLRYKREVLDVHVEGRNVVDVLAMPVDEALEVFASQRRIVDRLEPLARVGLGYLSLGQPLSTLSGGENQRLRLALALRDKEPGTLYVLDEPTTGLHPVDIHVLVGCLDQLLDAGGSVIVVEHNLEVIAQADYVLDMGPGGGPEGGRVVAQGTPDEVARTQGSATGAALRDAGLGG